MKLPAIPLLLTSLALVSSIALPQTTEVRTSGRPGDPLTIQYAGNPNHREITRKALQLAVAAGFVDSNLPLSDIQDRLEAGAYSEDYDLVSEIVGSHFPLPWDQGPCVDFGGYLPFCRIPYGSPLDGSSGWCRGLPHGYDPENNFKWPGAEETTIGWANALRNSFSWDKAREFYRQGKFAEAYECLGHLLHLLADMSIPQHVNLAGVSLVIKRGDGFLNADIISIHVDEYQMSLSGGLSIPGIVTVVPDLLGRFEQALDSAHVSNIPQYNAWEEYFRRLALLTIHQSDAERFYSAPVVEGTFGTFKDENGNAVAPREYHLTPPVLVANRSTQFSLRSTVRLDPLHNNVGTIIPEQVLKNMCDTLVPRAVEYCAGLLVFFRNGVTDVKEIRPCLPGGAALLQNYPNPFNPRTEIRYQVSGLSDVRLIVYDLLGRQVASLVESVQPAGRYSVTWAPSGLPSGVYICRMTAGDFTATKRLLFVK